MNASMCSLSCLDRGERGASEGFALKDREPDLDLVQPGRPGRREVELDIGMALEPAVVLGLMGVEIVEDDVEVLALIGGHEIVHEVEKFGAAPAIFMGCGDLTGRYLEGGKQRRGAVTLVVVALAAQRPPAGQFEIALGALQRLDRGLLIDANDDRVVRRRHIEPDNISRLGDEVRIAALAPGFAARKVNLLLAQNPPDMLLMHIAQMCRNQRAGPARVSVRRRFVQDFENAFVGLRRVARCLAWPWLVLEPLKAMIGKAVPRASWLNQVEIWFSILEGRSLTGASFTSVKQLREHIDAFIDSYNQNAKRFNMSMRKFL